MKETVNEPPLLKVSRLKKYFPVYGKGFLKKAIDEIRAVDDISFEVKAGETLGIVGESGSGKTTAVRCVLRAIDPTDGSVTYQSRSRGELDLASLPVRELKPLRKEIQMIFQDPFSSLNPRMTVQDIIGEPLFIHGLNNRRQIQEKVAAMLEKVGLETSHMQRYPHAFSGGQRQRIGIARALILQPRLVVADEAVSALDVSVQAQVINLLQDLQKEFKLTYLFVAHDLSVVGHLCDRVAVMYLGKIVELGRTEQIFNKPRHPYTKALLSAIPDVDPDKPLQPDFVGDIGDPERFRGMDMEPVIHPD